MVTINNSINNTVGASNSGVTNTLTVTNPSDTASSQAQILTTVGGTSSGDVWQQFSIGSTTSWAIGIDNSDSDKLKITTAASGTATPSDASPLVTFDQTSGDIILLMDQNATTSYQCYNNTDAANAQVSYVGHLLFAGGDNTFAIAAGNPASSTGRFAQRVELQTDLQSLGLNVAGINSAGTGTFRVYTGDRSTPTLTANCTAAGEWTYPVQPAFRATLSADATNVTGAGTAYTVAFNTEAYDQNADYNNATYTFTAPVTGIYHFDVTLFAYGVVAATTMQIALTNSAGTALQILFRSSGIGVVAASTNYCFSGSTTLKLTAADTVKVVFTASGEAGDVIDVSSGTSGTSFSGWLVC